jgi:integrase/recombinase XerC
MNSPGVRKPASQTTANDYYRALHSFFNWLIREEFISENPFDNLKAPRIEKKVIQALSENEIERLLSLCSRKTALDLRNRAILSLLIDCGLRVSELANINLADIDWESRSILIRKGKGGKQRMVHMGSKTYKSLWKYVTSYRNGESNRVFINRNGEPLVAVGIQILIKRLGQKAKIKVHCHKLRHTFAISYLRNGGDVFTLQYLLGHSTLQMTQRYLQSLNATDAANAHRKYSPLDNINKK